jgi:hypothetical protein
MKTSKKQLIVTSQRLVEIAPVCSFGAFLGDAIQLIANLIWQ